MKKLLRDAFKKMFAPTPGNMKNERRIHKNNTQTDRHMEH